MKAEKSSAKPVLGFRESFRMAASSWKVWKSRMAAHVKTGFHRMFVFYCQVDSEGLFAKLEKPGAESISREATGEAMRSVENPLSTHHFWVKATITLRLGLQVILFNPEKGYGLIRADGDAQVQFL